MGPAEQGPTAGRTRCPTFGRWARSTYPRLSPARRPRAPSAARGEAAGYRGPSDKGQASNSGYTAPRSAQPALVWSEVPNHPSPARGAPTHTPYGSVCVGDARGSGAGRATRMGDTAPAHSGTTFSWFAPAVHGHCWPRAAVFHLHASHKRKSGSRTIRAQCRYRGPFFVADFALVDGRAVVPVARVPREGPVPGESALSTCDEKRKCGSRAEKSAIP